MRISDWSSDVCSSDLKAGKNPPYPEVSRRMVKSVALCHRGRARSGPCAGLHGSADGDHRSRGVVAVAHNSRSAYPQKVLDLAASDSEHESAMPLTDLSTPFPTNKGGNS